MPGGSCRTALALTFAVAALSAARAGAQEVPFVLARLGLELRVDYERGSIGGSATLHLRNTSTRPRSEVPLLLNRLMVVARVRDAAGVAMRFEQGVRIFADDSSRQVNAILVHPGRPVAPGDSVAITLDYAGVMVGYTETGSLYIRDHVDRDFTIIREDAYAFPGPGVLSMAANRAAPREPFAFTARISVPVGLTVAMGGELRERARHDSLDTWTYHSREAVPFLNIAIAPFRVIERGGVKIFHFPADSAGARMVERAVAGAIERYTSWFGPLGHEPRLVVMEIPEGFGSQASLTAGIIQTADAFRDRAELRQLYHELSHLWNAADLDTPSPRWNEGLASFLQWRMAAELDGWAEWDVQVERAVQALLRRCAPPAACGTVPMADYGRSGLTDLSYRVGMLMFHALHQVLGAEAFDRAYRGFYQAHREEGGTTAELVAAFRAANPGSERVFADWLFSTRWHARLQGGESFPEMVSSYRIR